MKNGLIETRFLLASSRLGRCEAVLVEFMSLGLPSLCTIMGRVVRLFPARLFKLPGGVHWRQRMPIDASGEMDVGEIDDFDDLGQIPIRLNLDCLHSCSFQSGPLSGCLCDGRPLR